MSDLIFKTITLQDFKSFVGTHEFNLEREPGLFYVSGKNLLNPELGANGCGKTTLWDALTWCCWGKTGRDSRPANAIIPWGLEKGNTQVTFKFRRKGQTQILKRRRNPNSFELEIPKSGEKRVIAQEEVPGILGMSEDMFRRTVVLGQFGSLFLDIGPEKQSQMFNESLDLDIYLRASKVARDQGSTLDKDLTRLQQSLSSLTGRQTELQELLAREQEAAASYVKDCAVKLAALNALLTPKSLELDKLREAISPQDGRGRAKRGSGGAEALTSAITEKRKAWAVLGRQLADAEAQNRALGREKGELSADVVSYKQSIEGTGVCPECGQKAPLKHLEEKLAKARQALRVVVDQLEPILADIVNLPAQIDTSEDELRELERTQRAITQLEVQVNALQSERDLLEDEQNPHSSQVAETKKRLAKLETDIKAAEASVVELEEKKGVCDYWVDAFKEIRLSLIDQVLSELEMSVGRHAESLGLVDWGIKFQTERVNTAGAVSTSFTIMLYPPDAQEPVKLESYSGGENQRWQLAMAFGLSEVILSRSGVAPSIEVLDEPTRGLSSEGVEDLLTHLRARALELDRTIFVTEHHSLERGLFDGTITIRKSADGSSIVE